MERAIAHFHRDTWPAELAKDGITLDFDDRHRRRIRLSTDLGEEILLDLPKAIAMAHGDGLRVSDGRWLAVRAAPEALLDIRCATPWRFCAWPGTWATAICPRTSRRNACASAPIM